MMAFNMPQGNWWQRGGWVVQRLEKDLNLTLEEAAGIVGNLGFESAGFTAFQEKSPISGRGGWGWAQWTGPRRVAFEQWCTQHGLDQTSDEANYTFLVNELETTHRATVQALYKTHTLEEAVFSVGQTFERPFGTTPTNLPGYAERLTWARRALAGARLTPLPTDPGPTVAPHKELVTAWDKIKAIQVILEVKPDGSFGPDSKAALNTLLDKANQASI